MKRTRSFSIAFLVALSLGLSRAAHAAPADDVEARLQHALTHARIRAALLDKLGADALRIEIDLELSRVKLTGQVEKKSSQDLAREVALAVEGVTSVDAQLTVRPAGEPSKGELVEGEIKDALLVSRVKARLLAEIGTNALRIDVESNDGVVSLIGAVPSPEVRKLAVAKARSTKGVRKVVSRLKTA